jgi:hypothetical protein
MITYKSFFIELTTDLWALRNPKNIYSFSMRDGDVVKYGESIDDCKEQIDELHMQWEEQNESDLELYELERKR